jgi:pyruvate kinase
VNVACFIILCEYIDMYKKTKIVATIGPASEKKETLKQMAESGMNVARLNFSHGAYSWHQKAIDDIRELSHEMQIPLGIMADLQGPRIRTIVDSDFEIKPGEKILVYSASRDSQIPNSPATAGPRLGGGNDQNPKVIKLDYPGIIKDIEIGNEILIEDGLMKVKVLKKEKDCLEAEVIDGGTIKNEKGVNIPDAKLKIPPITEKDEKDLEFSLKNEVDFVAISFVSNAQEIVDLRDKIKKLLGRADNLPQIVAKIERKEAIKNLDEIISETDVVMVARGDLGIEMEESKVAVLQKEIIAKSLVKMKPVIVATQMLDSMIENPRPTRAEVSDVSNAVIDHADATMLSGETANGKYPVEVVKTMAEIIKDTEESPFDDVYQILKLEASNEFTPIVQSAYEISKNPEVKAIIVNSVSGFSARLISHFRPDQPILVATNNKKTYGQLSVVWGTEAALFETESDSTSLIDKLIEKAKSEGMLKEKDKVVVITGKESGAGKMNLVGLKEIN